MGKVLYRKYRPISFDDVVGQDHITSLLKKAVSSQSSAHAYLLTGPKGTGKTSVARIIAHQINDLEYDGEPSHLDIIEIDAASNNGVENIRDLREKVHIAPSSASKKVYIIDEVHMLSKSAFNALLKTLEEPPKHVLFILATTDVDKLPPTIISRVQRFNFRTVEPEKVAEQLRKIADLEKLKITDEALLRIAEYGEGSFRDSIGLFDQLSSIDGKITLELVNQTLGSVDSQTIDQLLVAHRSQDLDQITKLVNSLEASGANCGAVVRQIIAKLLSETDQLDQNLGLLDRLTAINLKQYPFIRLLLALTEGISAQPIAKPVPVPKEQESQPKVVEKPTSPVATDSLESDSKFSWTKFLEAAQAANPSIGALLKPAGHEVKDGKLLIYAKNKFNADRLKSTKFLPILNQSLAEAGLKDGGVDILPTQKPASDSTIQKITDIMGGGEEVSVDE